MAPGTGLLSVSVTVTASGTAKSVPSSVVCDIPTPAAMTSGVAAKSVRENVAMDVAPLTEAVTVKAPAVVPAVNTGLVATPLLSVCTVAVAPPLAKVAPAPAVVTTAKFTVAPATGSP